MNVTPLSFVAPDEPPEGLGEPNLRRTDKDADYGFEVWSVVCTTCGYEWFGKAWESCNRCIAKLEAEHGRFDDYQSNAEEPPQPPGAENYDDVLRSMLVDWDEFWAQDHSEAEWLAEPLIAAKRSTAIFAPGGTGKSLLALYISASMATGTTLFGRRIQPRRVLYLDYEMTADDLAERLQSMGFDDTVDLGNLHYSLLPSLPGLDQPEGGKAVVRLAELVDAEMVVIDTFGRAVHGDENDADTVRAWYRWTGIHLKHAGRAFLRVDHAGKDVSKGQRGSSAKNDDVDVVWQMVAKEGGTYTMTAKKRRMGWVPLSVDITMNEDHDMRFDLLAGHAWTAGTSEVAALLDELGIDEDLSSNKATKALKAAGKGKRATLVREAQKYRRERSSTLHFANDTTHRTPVDNSSQSASQKSGRTPSETDRDAPRDAPLENVVKPQVTESGRTLGRTRTHPSDASGTRCASPDGTHPPQRGPEDDPPTDEDIENAIF